QPEFTDKTLSRKPGAVQSANETDNNRMPAAELRHGRSGRV
ncbi:autotransporter outer membrane beta-barrel domain-containing protein, partial [Escherichia coli]